MPKKQNVPAAPRQISTSHHTMQRLLYAVLGSRATTVQPWRQLEGGSCHWHLNGQPHRSLGLWGGTPVGASRLCATPTKQGRDGAKKESEIESEPS